MHICPTRGPDHSAISMLKSMLFSKSFLTGFLTNLQHSCQPIRNHVRKSLLTNMVFDMDFLFIIRGGVGGLGLGDRVVSLTFSELSKIFS